MFFGDDSLKQFADAAKAAVRSTDNFNWSFIAIFAFVVMIYVDEIHKKNYKAIAAALQSSVAELYALAEGRTFATGSASSEVHPDDLARDAVQMRRYFRSLSPEYQKLALEIVKTLVRTQAKS